MLEIVKFLLKLPQDFAPFLLWLTTPLVELGGIEFSPLALFTFSGLTAIIVVKLAYLIAP